MTEKEKMVVDALQNPEIMCGACIYHGEPNGCNRSYGSCYAWDYADDAAELIKRQNSEIEKQKQVIADLEHALNQSEFEIKFWQTISED